MSHSSPEPYSLLIRMSSELEPNQRLPWSADVGIGCYDLPALMRKGLRWTTDDIDHERSGIEMPEEEPADIDRVYSRTWYILTKPRDGMRFGWAGVIQVYSYDLTTLSSFRLECLTRERITSARAHNPAKRVVFSYDYDDPDESFNCIDSTDKFDLKWLWRMESFVPEENKGAMRKLGCLVAWQWFIGLAILYALYILASSICQW